jgi:hypothetical protein
MYVQRFLPAKRVFNFAGQKWFGFPARKRLLVGRIATFVFHLMHQELPIRIVHIGTRFYSR